MKKRKLKKKPLIIIGSIIVFFIVFLIILNIYKHFTSYEYKLSTVGYNETEIKSIVKADKKYINFALKNDYNKHFVPLINQKYFILKNYKKYITYINNEYNNSKVDYEKVITKINTKTNYDYYTHVQKTNMDLGYGILTNKYYSLPDNYVPDDIEEMSSQYAYPNNKIRKEVYEAFKEMSKKAKEEKITLIVNSSYRDYKTQKELYDDYADKNGKEYADKYAARPNFSEHETGLAIDIFSPGYGMKNFETSEAFKWLTNNSYKYGFILRYPKEKEDITGYGYEAWHYRYLGKDLAKKVYESKLTFDEYYAYYLEK